MRKPLIRYNRDAQRWETRIHEKRFGFPWLDVYEAYSLEHAVRIAYDRIRAGR